jgi:hypothetical protein
MAGGWWKGTYLCAEIWFTTRGVPPTCENPPRVAANVWFVAGVKIVCQFFSTA